MASAQIKLHVNELAKINAEIKRLSDIIKPLRQRKKQIEDGILQYMQSVGNQGLTSIKLKDMELVTIEKKTRQKLKKDEKENTAVQLLQQSGVANARKMFYSLQEAMKGKEEMTHALKIKDPSKDKTVKY